MFSFSVTKSEIKIDQQEMLVSGAQRVYTCEFAFNGDWNNLTPTVVFTTEKISVSTLLDSGLRCEIPHEVLETARVNLKVGVYGVRDDYVLPTVWASLGYIQPGAAPAEQGGDPPEDVYAQILQLSTEAINVANSVRRDADAGEFNGKPFTYEDFTPEQLAELKGEPGDSGVVHDSEPLTTNPYSGAKTQEMHDRLVISKADAIMPTASGVDVKLEDSGAYPIQALTVYGKSTQDGVPTPESPVEIVSAGDSGSLTVYSLGASLPMTKISGYIHQTANSMSTRTKYLRCACVQVTPGAVYHIHSSSRISSNKRYGFAADIPFDTTDDFALISRKTWNEAVSDVQVTAPEGAKYLIVQFWAAGGTVDGTNVQDTTAYDTGHIDSVIADSIVTPDGNSAAVTTGLPLLGIPVASGGNVTVDGQQYIADTLEVRADGTGQMVKRITAVVAPNMLISTTMTKVKRLVVYEQPIATSYKQGLCSHAEIMAIDSVDNMYSSDTVHWYTNNGAVYLFIPVDMDYSQIRESVSFIYPLETPITIPLAAAEVQAILALHTFKPVTNLYNDAGAQQDVTYIADTKTYIDRKFEQLAAALVANV